MNTNYMHIQFGVRPLSACTQVALSVYVHDGVCGIQFL